ncbi:hypothetical protein Leryth_009571 [Lithospermum erythrorhizon]|nr:hypothetical protein Leryth_009571 [Lithospermum erythrorhizon]
MVFTFPNYLDHPDLHQFQQHEDHHQQPIGEENQQLHPVQAPPPPLVVGGIGGGGLIRPGSMTELPLPEAGARCPRCDSTNTKFCYYNNYNLSQPRHFCKGCRRYWTKGGSLRNVPVGGGCRRNKRSKSNGGSSSKSKAGDERQLSTKNNNNNSSSSGANNMVGHHFQQSSTQLLPFMGALHNFNQYAVAKSGSRQVNGLGDIRFNMLGNNLSGVSSAEPPVWMLPSFQGGFDPPTSLFQFQREGVENLHQLPSLLGKSSVKMENHQNNNQELNLSSQLSMEPSETRQTNWDANAWTNGFSGLNSSSSSHLL